MAAGCPGDVLVAAQQDGVPVVLVHQGGNPGVFLLQFCVEGGGDCGRCDFSDHVLSFEVNRFNSALRRQPSNLRAVRPGGKGIIREAERVASPGAAAAGTRQRRAERTTREIQSRSAPSRWVICSQVGASRATSATPSRYCRPSRVRTRIARLRVLQAAQPADDQPDDEDSSGEAERWMQPADAQQPVAARGEILGNGVDQIVRWVQGVS